MKKVIGSTLAALLVILFFYFFNYYFEKRGIETFGNSYWLAFFGFPIIIFALSAYFGGLGIWLNKRWGKPLFYIGFIPLVTVGIVVIYALSTHVKP